MNGVAAAFEKIFKLGRQPRLLWTDKGKEFYNKNVNQLLSRKNIKLYSTENEEKSSVAERFNRFFWVRKCSEILAV